MCLLISWWVVYKRTCPRHAECSVVFDQKQHDPHAPPTLFIGSCPKQFFLFPLMKKVLKEKCSVDVEEVKQKKAEALKDIKINECKDFFSFKK